ncbi:patatin-like phospholipase family protein [Actinomadura darangshiensis]|uniref:Patatin-like phospholipase family protein n=1 Tax=Actinomadura darangshiensis TaxID=705336 RepID=A0A4R5BWN1_9ACTN|nr:patatin-like phospholipase family protein [Actinomadura darangshiensis]TDD90166.1 patatin-like phospholipase family protein [Actinomadura darangshiensis]
MTKSGWALMLGPGGPVGTAWLIGLAAGLREAGVEPADAELIAGTSAGAIAGAAITAGRDLAELAELPPPSGPPPPVDGSVMARAFELGRDPDLAPDEVRRRIGKLALDAGGLPAERHRQSMRFLVGTDDWPDARLLITTVDVETGEPVVWDASSGAPLSYAVAASSAAPGFAEPVAIAGRRYMDGAFGGSYEHLAEDAGTVIVMEPLPHMPEGAGDVRIVPDEAALEAFGGNVGDRSRWAPVYRQGLRQAPEAAGRIRAALAARR